MKKTLLATLALFNFFLVAAFAGEETKLYAVKVHADWCGACIKMEPTVKAAEKAFSDHAAVEFVRFDLTSKATKEASQALAAAKNLSPVYHSSKKTGVLLLVNAQSGEVVGTYKSSASLDEITTAIQALL